MKRSILILIAALLLVSLVGVMAACGDDDEAPETTQATQAPETTAPAGGDAKVLRMAVPWPVGDPVTDNFEQNFINPFNEAQSQYRIELHPAGALLALPDSFEAVRTQGAVGGGDNGFAPDTGQTAGYRC